MRCVWNGKLPAYWSIANWALLTENYAVVLFREMETNRRKIQVVSLGEDIVQEMGTTYNILIGATDSSVLLSKIQDARTHDQLSRFGWVRLDSCQMEWEINTSALVEKFSVPYTLDRASMTYSCGLIQLDLASGEARRRNAPKLGAWPLGDIDLEQSPTHSGLITTCGKRIVWQKNDVYGYQYRGAIENKLFFLLPNNELVCIDKRTGNHLWKVRLENVTSKGRTKGTFDFYNETYARNSFIADILISRDMVVWATENEFFCILHIPTDKKTMIKKKSNQFLVDINDKYLMILTIEEEPSSGALTLYAMEELSSE